MAARKRIIAPSQHQWQYLVVTLDLDGNFTTQADSGAPKTKWYPIDDLGEEGWELTGTSHWHDNGLKHVATAFFKRRLFLTEDRDAAMKAFLAKKWLTEA